MGSDQEIWNCWWEGGGQEMVQEVMAKAQVFISFKREEITMKNECFG